MDLSSLIGMLLGIIGLVTGLLVGGADILIYADLSSVFITIFGSFGALMITHPLQRILMMPQLIGIIYRGRKYEEEKLIAHLVSFSEKARRDGLLALEDDLDAIEDPFFRKGIQLVVDGTDPEIIKMILYTELNKIEERHEGNYLMFDDWGKTAPAFGMIGTLTGLIAMMRRMEDKLAIGRGMAQALLTTLYGAVLAYLFLIPFKRKLEMKSNAETLVKEILIEGVLSIQAGDNPRILEEKLYTFLPPSRRESLRDEMTKT
ncbi:MAG: motility protein A [Spirochaetaceae bacterium]|nr:MAG: motility protein A [Spirochaetaceae bacterium]